MGNTVANILNNIIEQLTYNPKQPMIFSSGLFLFLFLGFSFVYMTLRNKINVRILFVTLFSYYFYYKSSGFYFALLAIVTLSDFYIAKAIYRYVFKVNSLKYSVDDETEYINTLKRKAKLLVTLSIFIDMGLLVYFKYTNFFAQTFSEIMGNNFQPWDIFLPVGISFFTFQSLSYTIDIYRGALKPLKSPLDYAFYVSFFPQLVAGPIVRATDFVQQIRKPINISNEMFSKGVYLILIGLFKKAVISDYISLNFVDRIFDNPGLYSGIENLLALYGYSIQIYCDFSGYSDMAIGIALLLGFHFPQNFNAPYTSVSITDFWRRWHISLSSWIKDYVYFSLGGNRKGKIRTYLNLIITMTACGLWHGAALNFIIWGFIHGLATAIHKFWSHILGHDKHYKSAGFKKICAIFFTFHFVMFAWLLFRSSSFDNAYTSLTQIFTAFHSELFMQIIIGYKYVFMLIVFGFITHFVPTSVENHVVCTLKKCNVVIHALLVVAIIYIVIQIKSSDIQPFIYFQF